GTIAENYGIFEAVELAKQLYKIDQKVTLTIIGYCALKKTLKRLIASVSGFNFIYLIGGDKLVPHTQIIEAIPKADFGLVSYQPNKSTENCIPTKMFEYMAHKLPMIVQCNPLWESFCNKHNAAIFLDYKNFDPQSLYNKMLTQKFYPEGTPQEVFWDTEEPKLIDLVQGIIS
ncbi:MAG: glycosyltransferase, partial [Bacteroidetes bacterium]|nr:glycosyltransferase [Bacteroidota bacterium]